MPLYAYRCTQCGHRFEKIQNFSAEPELVCPKCGGVLERPLTAPRLHFKGAGWYVNDYAAKSSEPSSDSGSESKASDSKTSTDAKTESATPAATAVPASAPASAPSSSGTSAPASSSTS